MRRDQRVVARMQPVQHRDIARQQRPPRPPERGPERRRPDMPDIDPGRRHVPPAQMPRAQAEIVLLAVALGERVLPQQPHFGQAVALEIEAEADPGRDLHHPRAVRRRRQPRQPPHRVPGPAPGSPRQGREAQDGGVVGERRGAADVRRRRRRRRADPRASPAPPACRCSAAPRRGRAPPAARHSPPPGSRPAGRAGAAGCGPTPRGRASARPGQGRCSRHRPRSRGCRRAGWAARLRGRRAPHAPPSCTAITTSAGGMLVPIAGAGARRSAQAGAASANATASAGRRPPRLAAAARATAAAARASAAGSSGLPSSSRPSGPCDVQRAFAPGEIGGGEAKAARTRERRVGDGDVRVVGAHGPARRRRARRG